MARSLACAALALFGVPTAAEAQVCGDEVVLNRLDAGTTGIELLAADGAPVVGGPFSLRIEGAFPNSSGALIYSPIEAPFFDPTYGAIFHFGVPFSTVFFGTDSQGSSPKKFNLPAVDPSLCGGFVIFQAGVFDPGAQNGVAVSNALRVVAGVRPARLFFGDPAGQSAADSVLGDLDGDGLRDLITAIPFSTRLGLPGGGFASTGVDIPFGGSSVEVADLNGDGHQDVLLASTLFGVYRGDGTGDFTGAAFFSSGGPRAVIDDFNLDGILDVATAGASTAFHPGTGLGLFDFPTTFATGPTVDVAVGDLDEDGFQDLVALNYSTDRAVSMLGDGTGDFELEGPFVVGFQPHRVVVGDFNGDTLLDIVTANEILSDITLRTGNGNGFFAPITTTVPTGFGAPRDLIATDLDGNGTLDLAVVNEKDEDVTVMLGNGDGTFPDVENIAGVHGPAAVEALDYDLDGDLDLVLFGESDGHVVLTGDGSGRFEGVRHFQVGEFEAEILVADMDRDGVDDVLVHDRDRFDVLLGARTGPLSQATYPHPTHRASLGDFDGDGFQDVLIQDTSFTDTLSVLLNAGDGTLEPPLSFQLDHLSHFAEDVNGDLLTDIVMTHHPTQSPGPLSVSICNGDGTFAAPTYYAASDWFNAFLLEDLNADGFVDALYGIDETIHVRLNAGDGTFGAEASYPMVEHVRRLLALDVAGGSELDLVYTTWDADTLHVRINAGDGTFGSEMNTPVNDAPPLVGDMNGDFALDLIIGTQQYLNQGDGTFAPGITIPFSLDEGRLVDVTDDGVLDLVGLEDSTVSSFTYAAAVSVRVGVGDGTFEPEVRTETTLLDDLRTGMLHVLDVDGDAILDAVVVATQVGDVTVYHGNGDGTFGSAELYFVGRKFPYPMFGILDFVTGDFDGDAIPDFFAANTDGRAAVLTNLLGE